MMELNFCGAVEKVLIMVALAGGLLLPGAEVAYADPFYASPHGDDGNTGTQSAPFRTIQHAFDVADAGDTIYLRGGTYRETVILNGISGTSGAPITLVAWSNETPVISGLDVESNLSWSVHSGSIYVASYSGGGFDQMFFNGKPMLEARWPNVPVDTNGDWNFFSSNAWAAVDSGGNVYGTIQDADLATTGWDVTGSRVVLNVDHQFYCFSRTVSTHGIGSDTFTYPMNLDASISAEPVGDFQDDRYYLVGESEYLDAPGEWVYDSVGELLYFYAPDGVHPTNALVEIKKRNYGIDADASSSQLVVDGITFQGTAFRFGRNPGNKSSNIVLKNSAVLHSSWSEYFRMPNGDPNYNDDRVYPTIFADNCVVANNRFAYGAMSGLLLSGFDNLLENNVFHDFNFNSSLHIPPVEVGRNWTSYIGTCGRAIVRWNTLFNSGGILMQTGQRDNEVYQNHLHNMFRSCWGGNKDVSALYTQSTNAVGARFHHNWIHDGSAGDYPAAFNGGVAIRGDDNTAGLTVDHNVMWNIGGAGTVIKSPDFPAANQANRSVNNTIFSEAFNLSTKHSQLVMSSVNDQNIHSTVANNISEAIYGGWGEKAPGTLALYTNNSSGAITTNLFENTAWYDFRPETSSPDWIDGGVYLAGITETVVGTAPDIGAYERGDSIYWIPGQRSKTASFPIVPNGALVSASRDVLMWRPAYNAVSHKVYFGTDPDNLFYQAGFAGETNVFTLPVLSARTYFWRVDAVMPDATEIPGEVWNFTVIPMPVDVVLDMTGSGAAGEALDGTDAQSLFMANGVTIKGSFATVASINPVGENNATQFGVKSDASNNTTIDPGETAAFTLTWDADDVESVVLKEVVFTGFYSNDDLDITVGSTFKDDWSYSAGDPELSAVSGATRRWTPATPIPIANGQKFEIAVGTNSLGSVGVGIESWTLVITPASSLPMTPIAQYNSWMSGYSVGASTGLLDHADSDALSNLAEYALDGDPSDGNEQGNVPVEAFFEEGGTNYIEYIYYARDDAADRGLVYRLGTDANLVSIPGWTNAFYNVTGTNHSPGISGFVAVTNRVPLDVPVRFIGLQVELAD